MIRRTHGISRYCCVSVVCNEMRRDFCPMRAVFHLKPAGAKATSQGGQRAKRSTLRTTATESFCDDSMTAMRTRSRPGDDAKDVGGGVTDPVLPTPPRSSKKRKAPTGAADVPTTPRSTAFKKRTTPSRAKKPKDETTASGTAASSSLNPPASSSSKDERPAKTIVEPTKKPLPTVKSAEKNDAIRESTSAGQDLKKNESDSASSIVGGFVVPVAPRGRSVSGRDWKARNQSQRASMQVTTATENISTTWAKKLELKAKRQAIAAMEQEMKDAKRQEIEDKKQEKIEREKRRQQNEMKNTTYQTISKTHKMKTMSKKQLRQIKKRQVNSRTGEIEFVSPWGGGKKK